MGSFNVKKSLFQKDQKIVKSLKAVKIKAVAPYKSVRLSMSMSSGQRPHPPYPRYPASSYRKSLIAATRLFRRHGFEPDLLLSDTWGVSTVLLNQVIVYSLGRFGYDNFFISTNVLSIFGSRRCIVITVIAQRPPSISFLQ